MTNLRKAAQQALDALLRVQPQVRGAIPQQDTEDAIDAVRAALAEPVQEPVAWAYVNSDDECEQIEYETPPNHPSITPLYAAPPQRKPLTNEEIDRMTRERWGSKLLGAEVQVHREYARAIERAHGIGT